jgi:hypothetical protein
MKNLGDASRELGEGKQQPLQIVVAYLEAILSRIERGQRKSSREQVVKLEVNAADLFVAWLSDKVVYEVLEEDIAWQALNVAEEKVKYNKTQKI